MKKLVFCRELVVRVVLSCAAAVFLLAGVAVGQSGTGGPAKDSSRLVYPEARRGDQVDDYHGTKVADPYRWLEDPDSAETRAWIEAENKISSAFLEKIPVREAIRKRLKKLLNYERYGLVTQRAGRYFYEHNDGLQNQDVLYWSPSLDATPIVLLDPNLLSKDGTVALSDQVVSNDGKLLGYALSTAGSDWQIWHVRDVKTGKDLSDELKWIKNSMIAWAPDSKGFYYGRYEAPTEAAKLTERNYNQKLYYHMVGTLQSEDRLVYERPDEKEWEFAGTATEDGKYLVIQVFHGTDPKNLLYYQRLDTPGAPVVKVVDQFEAEYNYLGNDGSVFWFLTDLDAPLRRVVAIDPAHPEREKWRTIVPESADVIESANIVGNQLFLSYLKDAHSVVKVYNLDGSFVRDVELPGIGTVFGFTGLRTDRETFFGFSGFTMPRAIYRYQLNDGKVTLFRQSKVDFNPDDYETKQVFYTSRDGTRVPTFICYKKGLELNGQNPTQLYGYGGFNISLAPHFSVGNLVWMEMGGVYAQPSLRGGGEYGRAWHEAGMKLKKQNVFDDFIAAAQWLVDEHYTSTAKLGITGASNGGLLVGACLTQRPDLFGATLPGVGVMDMLRFNKFTIGWEWTSDYGSPENAEEFKALLAYSPLHNIKPGTKYPATLVTTADHDDRVVPAHSFKFTAALQAAQAGPAPILIRIDTDAGHGGGKPLDKIVEERADELAFLAQMLGASAPAHSE